LSPHATRAAFYLDTPRGRRFCVTDTPTGEIRGALLFIPPFAEELNKSRRMTSLAARAFAASGWVVLRPDLGGCGDSEGDFGAADWRGWVADVDDAWNWLALHAPDGRRVLWTLRAGSLLAAAWLRWREARPDMLLWQPVFDGERHLQQFLRLELARQMLAEGEVAAAAATLRARLDAGETVEIAGYALNARLTRGLQEATFELPPTCGGRVDLFELGPEATPSPALISRRDALCAAGVRAECHRVEGPAFWQTAEIELATQLLEKSLAALAD
jgi:exosortase A-associated hydrolase 2